MQDLAGACQELKRHVKVALRVRGLTGAEWIPCEGCAGKRGAVDCHHLTNRGVGGSKALDVPENLAMLCRECHERCHKSPQFNESVRKIIEERFK